MKLEKDVWETYAEILAFRASIDAQSMRAATMSDKMLQRWTPTRGHAQQLANRDQECLRQIARHADDLARALLAFAKSRDTDAESLEAAKQQEAENEKAAALASTPPSPNATPSPQS